MASGAGFWFGTLIRACGGALREWRLVDIIFVLPSASLAGIFQKGAYTLVWCADFCGCCQGTPLHRLALVFMGHIIVGLTGL